ncbi:hypothetical protein [Pontibacter litorisediminis]|uniref:hypothetical protein n=1 Tax=Pontibacter litorisediminis TaxID=1846260 RepID=UPI0023EAC8FD|nr:hypothetical protein [Pontibacter litorisediminis]
MILAKEKDKLYFFTYTSPYKNLFGRPFPGNLSQKFREEESKFDRTVPDTNRYFLPKRILHTTLSKHWDELQASKLWELKDDRYTLKSIGSCMIEHGNTSTFYLITKGSVKVLSFYAPDFWEECLEKNINRQKAIEARDTFQRIGSEE